MKQFLTVCAALLMTASAALAIENTCEQEKEEGFVQLYAGGEKLCPNLWTGSIDGYPIENGLIVCREGGKLLTKDEFSDFVFRFEFRIPERGNNGVGIRCPIEGDAAYNGMEIQILSEQYEPVAPYQKHGSIYGVIPARTGALNPDGEWNTEEIYAEGSHIKVTVNDKVIVDADIAKITGTIDGQDHPGLHNESGHIGFLGHGDPVSFRNVRVKKIEK